MRSQGVRALDRLGQAYRHRPAYVPLTDVELNAWANGLSETELAAVKRHLGMALKEMDAVEKSLPRRRETAERILKRLETSLHGGQDGR